MENERYNRRLSLNSMHCGKTELCYLAQTLCLLGESNLGVTENSLMFLRGQKQNVSIEENSPSDP